MFSSLSACASPEAGGTSLAHSNLLTAASTTPSRERRNASLSSGSPPIPGLAVITTALLLDMLQGGFCQQELGFRRKSEEGF